MGRLKTFKKGDMVKAKVLDVDVVKERISLGIKQLSKDDDIMNILTKAADKFAVAIAFSAGDLDRALRSLWHI